MMHQQKQFTAFGPWQGSKQQIDYACIWLCTSTTLLEGTWASKLTLTPCGTLEWHAQGQACHMPCAWHGVGSLTFLAQKVCLHEQHKCMHAQGLGGRSATGQKMHAPCMAGTSQEVSALSIISKISGTTCELREQEGERASVRDCPPTKAGAVTCTLRRGVLPSRAGTLCPIARRLSPGLAHTAL
eukprot:1155894-Pelagomonas_calceolata.AAC.1